MNHEILKKKKIKVPWLDVSKRYDLNRLKIDEIKTLSFYYSSYSLGPELGDYDISESMAEKHENQRVFVQKYFPQKTSLQIQESLEAQIPAAQFSVYEFDHTPYQTLKLDNDTFPPEILAQGFLQIQKVNQYYVLDVNFDFHLPLACTLCFKQFEFSQKVNERISLQAEQKAHALTQLQLTDEEEENLEFIEDGMHQYLEKGSKFMLLEFIAELIQSYIPTQAHCQENCQGLNLKVHQMVSKNEEKKVKKINPFEKLKDFAKLEVSSPKQSKGLKKD